MAIAVRPIRYSWEGSLEIQVPLMLVDRTSITSKPCAERTNFAWHGRLLRKKIRQSPLVPVILSVLPEGSSAHENPKQDARLFRAEVSPCPGRRHQSSLFLSVVALPHPAIFHACTEFRCILGETRGNSAQIDHISRVSNPSFPVVSIRDRRASRYWRRGGPSYKMCHRPPAKYQRNELDVGGAVSWHTILANKSSTL